jgi:hypothetical protein
MDGSPSMPELVANAESIAELCFSSDSADQCDTLDQIIHDIDSLARESVQAQLTDELLRIAAKLEAGSRPTEEEERLIEIVIIGAGAEYIATENNVADWKAEIRRLIEELRLRATDQPDLDALLRVRALCRDAIGVLPDLRHWMEESGRVRRFRESAGGNDPERGPVLAGFIRSALASKRR